LLPSDTEAARGVLRQLVADPFRFTLMIEDGRGSISSGACWRLIAWYPA
jgi:hypothetical protein